MEITAAQVKELRALTNAPMLDCKKALEAAGGDPAQAVAWLKEKGLAKASKKMGREANAGQLELYTHGGGRVGVMVEVNCETDFVARTEQFKTLAHELALQVAAASPRWLKVEDVPAAAVEEERADARQRAVLDGKPENDLERLAAVRLQKFYQETCLLSQPYIRDDKKTVHDLLQEAIGSTGENIVIRRFVRWELGGEA